MRHRASRSTSQVFGLISILELSDCIERLDLFSLLPMLLEETLTYPIKMKLWYVLSQDTDDELSGRVTPVGSINGAHVRGELNIEPDGSRRAAPQRHGHPPRPTYRDPPRLLDDSSLCDTGGASAPLHKNRKKMRSIQLCQFQVFAFSPRTSTIVIIQPC